MGRGIAYPQVGNPDSWHLGKDKRSLASRVRLRDRSSVQDAPPRDEPNDRTKGLREIRRVHSLYHSTRKLHTPVVVTRFPCNTGGAKVGQNVRIPEIGGAVTTRSECPYCGTRIDRRLPGCRECGRPVQDSVEHVGAGADRVANSTASGSRWRSAARITGNIGVMILKPMFLLASLLMVAPYVVGVIAGWRPSCGVKVD